MAAKRGKSQARRNARTGGGGLPGWAWMVLGVVLTLVVLLAAPKWLKSDGGDGFFRPHPNPDAQPAAASDSEDDAIVPDDAAASTAQEGQAADAGKPTYDFYTMLPSDEVVMTDAELAASERAEAERQARADAADEATPAGSVATATADAAAAPAPSPAAATPRAGSDTPYILQAGAFAASGDAEAVKARIALLGLGARVESAEVQGKTVYRVRMGPYGTASELAEAKRKLASGGLPALAIKAR